MAASGEPDPVPSDRPVPIVIIAGPTGSGKSQLAIAMAQEFGAEVISADSRQIYRQLKIGTDRLEEREWHGVVHHLTGTIDLGQRFTAFDFLRQAVSIINRAYAEEKRIIVCGGTGLYLRALTDGIIEIADDDLAYRNELLDIAGLKGPQFVYQMLVEADPEAALELHPHNLVRVIRVLEIYRATGLKRSELAAQTTPADGQFRYLKIVLMPDRKSLYEKIEARVDRMVQEGLVEEARVVIGSPFGGALRTGKILGYQELLPFFEGQMGLAEAVTAIKQNTRRYAKRQFTWFRALHEAHLLGQFGEDAAVACRGMISGFWEKKALFD
jgi:tRNA dimethylallyltransferase